MKNHVISALPVKCFGTKGKMEKLFHFCKTGQNIEICSIKDLMWISKLDPFYHHQMI